MAWWRGKKKPSLSGYNHHPYTEGQAWDITFRQAPTQCWEPAPNRETLIDASVQTYLPPFEGQSDLSHRSSRNFNSHQPSQSWRGLFWGEAPRIFQLTLRWTIVHHSRRLTFTLIFYSTLVFSHAPKWSLWNITKQVINLERNLLPCISILFIRGLASSTKSGASWGK